MNGLKMNNCYITQTSIAQLVEKDMNEVNSCILKQLDSEVELINQLGNYIISGGGKRIRPTIAILSAKALNYLGEQHIVVAALIELLHTSTLLHDDVVDESSLRRGRETANSIFGNAASVLVGDFIYTRSFQMMVNLKSLRLLEIMSAATNVIAEGEVMQLMNCNDPNLSEENYMHVIYSKTARLFEAASHSSAILAQANPEQEKALQDYGRYIGTAFQLIDDMLDYSATGAASLGKNLGDDLNEGKPTLPLLHAMHHSDPADAILIRQAIEQGNGRHLLERVLSIMQQHGSLKYTQQRAEKEAEKAIKSISCLEDTPYKHALESLAYVSVKRNY